MKSYKFLLLIITFFLFFSFAIVGCTPPRAANLVAIDFYDLIVKQTTNPSLFELGLSEEVSQKTIDHIKTKHSIYKIY